MYYIIKLLNNIHSGERTLSDDNITKLLVSTSCLKAKAMQVMHLEFVPQRDNASSE